MPRKRFSETDVLTTVQWQLSKHNIWLNCFRCEGKLFSSIWDGPNLMALIPAEKIEREHYTEIALGGADQPSNCVYSHQSCHSRATNGTKATTAGSSKQRIAKVRRLLNPKPSKHPMKSGGQKLKGRGFDKSLSRSFSGKVTKRS